MDSRMSAKLSSQRSSPTKGRAMSPIEDRKEKQKTPPPVATSTAERVKANSSNFPSAPGRREVIPRSKNITETVGEAMKKKVEQKKNATITEENEDDSENDF